MVLMTNSPTRAFREFTNFRNNVLNIAATCFTYLNFEHTLLKKVGIVTGTSPGTKRRQLQLLREGDEPPAMETMFQDYGMYFRNVLYCRGKSTTARSTQRRFPVDPGYPCPWPKRRQLQLREGDIEPLAMKTTMSQNYGV